YARSFEGGPIVQSFILNPLTNMGGVFSGISMLPPIWQAISKVNPIVYMISGFRYGLLGVTDVPVAISLSNLVVFGAVLYSICWYLISKGRGLRS
ncbi:ABC transporter permease, partial [Listeria monocytogenes]|uniref:ABC transporter permease n=1 Tax=Listeria monocytogenes TaxID=1639 RepID=UPI0014940715